MTDKNGNTFLSQTGKDGQPIFINKYHTARHDLELARKVARAIVGQGYKKFILNGRADVRAMNRWFQERGEEIEHLINRVFGEDEEETK